LAHTHSARKRVRQTAKRHERNKVVTTHYRNRIKECRAAIAAGDPKVSAEKFARASQAIHGAVAKGVLHENTANRYISRLARAVNAVHAAKPSTAA